MKNNNKGSLNQLLDNHLLDIILDRLNKIEGDTTKIKSRLTEIMLLEERINSQHKTLVRFGEKLDGNAQKLYEHDLWRAGIGDNKDLKAKLDKANSEILHLSKNIDKIESHADKQKGEKIISNRVSAWLVALGTSIFIWFITKGR